MPEYWHVRINSSRNQPNSDFQKMMNEIISTRKALWDKDSNNRIQVGDYLGFITGPKNKELVYIYKVIEEFGPEKRHKHWASLKPHTDGNGKTVVNYRDVIVITNMHTLPLHIEWDHFRRITGLGGNCEHWMPRGTQIVKQKEKLPFDLC